ncbi:LPXTG cell wall anchor domain-containing protein [Candidatus Woesearchaeota archaeon]|nr:MAG: LPXTG cell wall anchor domain-containing protein [Candidatus Woesearchaeota archaeon]
MKTYQTTQKQRARGIPRCIRHAAPLLTLLLVMVGTAHATLLTTGGSSFDISLLNYEPVPAQPGDILDVWITLENEGSAPANDITIEIIDTYPFTTDSEDDRIKFASTIPAQESFLFKTKVRVDSDADVGTNYLHVRVTQGSVQQEADLAITIVGETSSLNVARAEVQPAVIAPGERATLSIVVENVGNTLLRNVEASLDFDDVDVAPVESGSSKSIDKLPGGSSHEFSFPLLADPDAAPGVYKIPLTLTYTDRAGTNQTEEESIGIVIGSTPELLVYFDKLDLSATDREGTAVIKVVNKGLDEVKLVQLDIIEGNGVHVTSESAQLYVGNIDNDDYENAQVRLKLDEGVTAVPVVLTFKDSLNREYKQRFMLPVRITEKSEEQQTNWPLIIVIVLIVLGGGWWLFRRRGKR